jgi:hypothetical protein
MTMFIAFAKPSSLPALERQVYVIDKKGDFLRCPSDAKPAQSPDPPRLAYMSGPAEVMNNYCVQVCG